MLDALVDRQNRDVPGAPETATIEQQLQIAQGGRLAVALHHHTVDEVGPRQVEEVLADGLALVAQENLPLVAKDIDEPIVSHFLSPLSALDATVRVWLRLS
jgi:hypothetical protein